MALYMLFGIVVLIFLAIIYWSKGEAECAGGRAGAIFGTTLCLVIIAGLLLGFMTCIGLPLRQPKYGTLVKTTKYQINIVSIRGNASGDGSFFLGCGIISSTRYYVYFEKMDDGGLIQKQVPADNAIIYEEKNCKPRICWEGRKYICSDKWLPEWYAPVSQELTTKKHIYVPKGTVIQEFKLN